MSGNSGIFELARQLGEAILKSEPALRLERERDSFETDSSAERAACLIEAEKEFGELVDAAIGIVSGSTIGGLEVGCASCRKCGEN